MKFQRIRREKANFPVAVMCDGLGVSRSGYYAFEKRPPSKRAIEDVRLGVEIAESFRQSRGTYGSPRVLKDLIDNGHRVSRKRVARIMRSRALCARVDPAPKKWTHRQHPSRGDRSERWSHEESGYSRTSLGRRQSR